MYCMFFMEIMIFFLVFLCITHTFTNCYSIYIYNINRRVIVCRYKLHLYLRLTLQYGLKLYNFLGSITFVVVAFVFLSGNICILSIFFSFGCWCCLNIFISAQDFQCALNVPNLKLNRKKRNKKQKNIHKKKR